MDNKILVTRSSMPSMEEYIEEIRSIWDSHWLTNMGEKHKALQAELQKYMGVPAVELLTNGHMALELSLQAMNLQGEVITTPFTFSPTEPVPSCRYMSTAIYATSKRSSASPTSMV